jgi:hypothetical protein
MGVLAAVHFVFATVVVGCLRVLKPRASVFLETGGGIRVPDFADRTRDEQLEDDASVRVLHWS